MSESSRKGRRIASKACDLCRERKVQCVFGPENPDSCQRCLKSNGPCTFNTDRKTRGPPSRRVAEARKRAELAGILNHAGPSTEPGLPLRPGLAPGLSPQAAPLPLGRVTVEHLIPEKVFGDVMSDYVDRVYPVLPLVHVPTLQAKLEARCHDTQPAFFRLCLALCAVTMASIPRQMDVYGCGHLYKNVSELVDRASHLVLVSRLATEPAWQNSPTQENMIVSVILAMASHYAGRVNAGWSYAAEAVQFFRAMQLYSKAAYAELSTPDSEMCKRAFWVLYIIQIHDRLSFTIPHTGMSYDPVHTDWEFLVPLEIRDELLAGYTTNLPSPYAPPAPPTRPVITGFNALVRVFMCVGDMVSKAFPGAVPAYNLSPGPLNAHFLPEFAQVPTPPPGPSAAAQQQQQGGFSAPSLETLFQVIKRLHATLADLPDEFQLQKQQPGGAPKPQARVARQFEIMRVNIHVTSLYLQSCLLELCLNTLDRTSGRSSASASASAPTSAGHTPFAGPSSGGPTAGPTIESAPAVGSAEATARVQLWEFRESLARELLGVVTLSSPETLEANGQSTITKIREIAASLLDRNEQYEVGSDVAERNRQYVARFVGILAKLDYAARNLG